jgi:hypothetical protein
MQLPASSNASLLAGFGSLGLLTLAGFVNVDAWSDAAVPEPLDDVPYGGFSVQLSHSGEHTFADQLAFFQPSDFVLTGLVVSETSYVPSEPLGPYSIRQLVLGEHGMLEPRRSLELATGDGKTWRLELAAFSGKDDLTPDLGFLVGQVIELRAHSVMFGVTRFAAVRIDDADGLVLALDYRVGMESEAGNLRVERGPDLRRISDTCGTFATSSLRFDGATSVLLRPGQPGALTLGDLEYRAQPLAASFLVERGSCTCLVNDVAWAVQRRPEPT